MKEWKNIEGYEGLYQVSNLGRVKSIRSNTILRPYDIGRGYLAVKLCKNGINKNHKLHRLVAEAFIPNPDNLPCVNHKDENKANNCVDNLEWCSYSYNNNYGDKNKPILQYTIDGEFVKEWKSLKEVAESFGVGHSNISCCCHKRYGFKTAYGYIWEFKKAG